MGKYFQDKFENQQKLAQRIIHNKDKYHHTKKLFKHAVYLMYIVQNYSVFSFLFYIFESITH